MTIAFTIMCVSILNGMEPTSLSELRRPGKEITELTPQETVEIYQKLLPELKQYIFNTALAASNDLSEAITILQKLSALHKVNYNLKNATVVRALMKKFPTIIKDVIIFALEQPEQYQTIDTILKQNKTINVLKQEKILQDNLKNFTILLHIIQNKHQTYSTAHLALNWGIDGGQYIHLGNELLGSENPTEAKEWIERGADVNFINKYDNQHYRTPLIIASIKGNAKVVTCLLNNGANPYLTVPTVGTALDAVKTVLGNVEWLKNHADPKMKEKLETVKIILEQAMENYPPSLNTLSVFAQ